MDAPLSGWTVVVTRAENGDGPLGRAFEAEGARVLRVPVVAVGPPEDPSRLLECVAHLDRYDWIVFTSPRAVASLSDLEVAPPPKIRIAAVGPATAERATATGMRVDLVGTGEGAEALARMLVDEGIGAGTRVFFPASGRAAGELARILGDEGALVEQVTAYETRVTPPAPDELPSLEGVDVVTFTSPSAVEGWCAAMARSGGGTPPGGVRYVAIGSTTAQALSTRGLSAVVAPTASFEGMVRAVKTLGFETRSMHVEEGS